MRIVCAILALLLAACDPPPTAPLKSVIWYGDNNLGSGTGIPADFVSKFETPESWQHAADHISVYLLRVSTLEKKSDAFLTGTLKPFLDRNEIALGLNATGATWMNLNQAQRRRYRRDLAFLRRLERLGIEVDYIALQSVLSKPTPDGTPYPGDQRIKEAALYNTEARAIFPKVKMGIIDAMLTQKKDWRTAYRQLKDATKVDFVLLDLPVDVPLEYYNFVNWNSALEVERYVKSGIAPVFGLIATSDTGNVSADKWHQGTMTTLECYAAIGSPDFFAIMAWWKYPEKTVPDTGPTMMRTVREFGDRLNQIKQQGRPEKGFSWHLRCRVI